MRALDPRLVRRTRPARALLITETALGIATLVPLLAQATLLARIVARAFDGAPVASLRGDLLLLGAAFAARGALGWGMEVAGRRVASRVLSELRVALAARRVRAQPAATDGALAGELAAVAVQGVDALEAYFGRYLPQAVLATIVPPAIVAYVAVVDVESALLMLLTVPLVPVFMWLIGRAAEEHAAHRWEAMRSLSERFLDVVRGLPTLRAFNAARDEAAALADVGERYRRAAMGTLRVGFLSGSVLELAATLGVALVAVTVGVRLTGGGLGLQSGLTVLILAPELYLPLRRLGAEYHASADGRAVADRLLALVDAPSAAPGDGRLEAPSPAVAPVRLEGVSFAYPARAGLVLDDLWLELHPGETLALVGPSGTGKSTIAALLLGLLAPTAGRISVGGVDLAACRIEDWRRHVAWVPQRPTMLRGSVADNIRLGAPDASATDVRAAAAMAGAHAFVRALPHGYDTLVGDGARPLSPGEERRIALARAVLRRAPLLVLDEPTADLDPASVEQLAVAVRRAGRGRTVLLIAHRPELVAHADRVVRLDGGTVSLAEEVAA